MGAEYWALFDFVAVLFVVFVFAIVWLKYRRFIKRRLNLTHYRDNDSENVPHTH
jgi:hypothetical protein